MEVQVVNYIYFIHFVIFQLPDYHVKNRIMCASLKKKRCIHVSKQKVLTLQKGWVSLNGTYLVQTEKLRCLVSKN